MLRTTALLVLLVLAVISAACSASEGDPAGVLQPTPAATATVSSTRDSTPNASTSPSTARDLEAWQSVALRDVRSGETFTIGDLAGSLVVIEPMAIWCSNCLRQQEAASRALAELNSDRITYVSLDIDPSEAEADLARYADEHGFDWRFAVAPRELSRALAESFGDQVLSPPSTPRIVVTPDGRVIGPAFGMANARVVEAELRELLP
jgi:hypothetical protein